MPGSNIIIYRDSREVLFAFNKDAAIVSKKATERNTTDSEAVEIAKAANIAHLSVLGPP